MAAPAVADGEASPEGVKPVLPVTAKLGSVDCEVVFAEMVVGEIGKLRVRVKVPEGVSGDQPLVVSIGGRESNAATVAIAGA